MINEDVVIERIPDKWIDRLILRLCEIYKEEFDILIDTDIKKNEWIESWKNELIGVTANEIKNILSYCSSMFSSPPSASQFRKAIDKIKKQSIKKSDDISKNEIDNSKKSNANHLKTDRDWAKFPKSQAAVDLMFSDPPMTKEIEIAKQNGFIDENNMWIKPEGSKK